VTRLHTERHLVSRIGWLRAAVLGANDGLVSTASLIVGVAAASASSWEVREKFTRHSRRGRGSSPTGGRLLETFGTVMIAAAVVV
jgi:VIT1/CCC1 family predicted Fe2+/Mn2+ transporter